MMKYNLVGIDGNAYYVMGYTAKALKAEGLRDLVNDMYREATSGDYNKLICVCMGYIDKANAAAEQNGTDDGVEEEEEW